MTKEEAQALRSNLAAQVKLLVEPTKAIIVILYSPEPYNNQLTYESVNLGAGEMIDRLADVKHAVLEAMAKT